MGSNDDDLRSSEDDFRSQPEASPQAIEDDLRSPAKTTSETKQRRPPKRRPRRRLSKPRRRPSRGKRPSELGRRPSTQAIGSRCSSSSDAPEVGQGTGLYPRTAPSSTTLSRSTGPSGPPLHQIMTTGTPLDPVVIRLRS